MHSFIESRWFALSSLMLVIASGVCLYLWPQVWAWALLPPVVMSILRLVVRPASFQTPLWVVGLVIFLTTAAIGYTVAYNETNAWNKFCLLVVAVLLYVNVAAQPVQHSRILAWLGLLTGFGVASYFLLTADFTTLAVKFQWIHQLGVAWMNVRPNVFQGSSIHPNDTAGLSIIVGVYGLPLLRSRNTGWIQKLFVLAAMVVILIAVVLASSRGAFLGLIGALGIWFASRLLPNLAPALKKNSSAWFPNLVILGILILEVVVLFLPSTFLGSSFSVSGNVLVSRADVFRSGLTILRDFPFTGGGLASFPGLYSQYVLVTPFYVLPHSHNMILNVMIEQGLLGGIIFVSIYGMAIGKLLSVPQNTSTQYWYLAACISLFTALFHGMVDDYLYETSGPALALLPAGMAILVSRRVKAQSLSEKTQPRPVRRELLISPQYAAAGALVATVLLGFFWKPMAAQWYANMGAVRMAKIELADFPSGQWSEGEQRSRLDTTEIYFQQALAYQAENETANQRLGLIRMHDRDYESASVYLQRAHEADATNRGVIKNLGYSYLWSGDTIQAQSLLSKIPEAKHELEVYIWWWNERQRPDLSDRASQLSSRLATQP